MAERHLHDREMPRRTVLGASAAFGATAWLPLGTVGADSALAVGPRPPALPGGLEPYQTRYRNWVGEIRTDPLWTCSPRTAAEVAGLANWARAHGWRLRAQGRRHTWAPLTVADGTARTAPVLLVDTTRHLNAIGLDSPTTVRVQTGATMERLLAFLGDRRLGVTACPAPGDLTVGGVLAIGGHGTAVPAAGERRPDGHGYGTLSNQVTQLTAVVWDEAARRYTLRTFDRSQADTAAFLVHLGRAFLTEVVLRVGADRNLRCVSLLDIPADELFARPGTVRGGRSFADFLDRDGRAEAIWFAFTEKPWLKVWSVEPTRPLSSRAVTEPYNYPFSDRVPEPLARLIGRIVAGAGHLTPLFGQIQYLIAKVGLTGDLADVLLSDSAVREVLTGDLLTHLVAGGLRSDLWGPSRTLLQYVRPTTLRVTANGYAVLVRRADVQWALAEFTGHYRRLVQEYRQRGRYPVNGAVEIRVTGLDDPAWSGVPGARPPLLSPVRPRADRPEWDTALWLDVLTLPGTPHLHRFLRDVERFLWRTFDGTRAALRVEWSKGWAYTDDAAWADQEVIDRRVPDSLRAGGGEGWDEAVAVLNRHDPHRVFGTAFLDSLLS
ncbi:cholesterol oxidase substrate-binding domain-containing protein [Streptomyces sp. NPDC052676]|uniref:cholesterol oxidase substrate-binding domain-containing protein n=1 Tax=Streptomyces sp. NPDC052676 TaxID=3154953 RepID=UPI0034409818